jgi:hypothetical protein
VIALAFGICSSVAFAQNTAPATSTDTVKSRLPGDGAVKAAPKAKPNPVGQKATDYHPKVKTRKAAVPPSPVTSPVTSTTTKKSN